jgi:GntR family transcriptional regulator/MocR family aminotransferase
MDLMIRIDRASQVSLVEQVVLGIREAIENGTLQSGKRLPSTRESARQLGLTRFTVDDAYSRLVGEGYLEARLGSGTYVAQLLRLPRPVGTVPGSDAPPERRLSSWAARLPAEIDPGWSRQPVEFTFASGMPALDRLPLATWRRLIARETRDESARAYSYGPTAGHAALREAIAAYVARARGVTCTPDQVIVTSGAQQSIDLVMRMVLDERSAVVLEDPGYRSLRTIAGLTGATILPVPVDGDGLMVERLPPPSPDLRLACITPSHQYPTGAILPLSRRLELLHWAQEAGVLILEDDYDGELRYDSRPVPALAALASAGNGQHSVIYVGSFSKVLFPSIRLGYLVVPPDLTGPFVRAKAAVERQAPTLSQAAVATFIAEGHFERHLAKMRRLYSARHDALLDAMDTHLAGIAYRDKSMRSAGLHVLARFDVEMTVDELVAHALAHGIALDGSGFCYSSPPAQPHITLGYTVMPEERIRAGIARLAEILS